MNGLVWNHITPEFTNSGPSHQDLIQQSQVGLANFTNINNTNNTPNTNNKFANDQAYQQRFQLLNQVNPNEVTTSETPQQPVNSNTTTPVVNNQPTVPVIAPVNNTVPQKQGLVGKYAEVAKPYMSMVQQASKDYGIPPEVILSVMQTESGFKPNATSPTGVKGLMQVTQKTYNGLGFTGDRTNPENSIGAGSKLLSQLYNQYGNWEDTLAAYNGGADGVKGMRTGDWGIWADKPSKQKEIQQYARTVLNNSRNWTSQ